MNKRGLSAIITTLLIVMLVLVAVGIVWAVVRGVIRGGAEGIGSGARCLNIDVSATAINCNTPSACVIIFDRTGSDDGEIGGVKLVFFESTDTSGVIDKDDVAELGGNIEALAGKTVTVDSKLSSPDKLEVTVYLEDESGNEQLCEAQTTSSNIGTSVGGGDDGGAVCGDGICDYPEETCLSCPEDCGDCEGEFYCGDGDCNDPDETCENCVADCGVCGADSCDGVWDPPEDAGVECDGGTGCADCVCDTGYVPADPLGPDCIVDPAVDCNGIFEEGEQCDGGANCIAPGGDPPGEPNECTCPAGYDPEGIYPDGDGGCIERLALISGVVEEVWPIGSVMYFASDSLPKGEGDDILYSSSGYYVKFPGSSEPDCLLIVNYVLPFGTYEWSHIAFNSEAAIIVGDDYGIWGDSSCT